MNGALVKSFVMTPLPESRELIFGNVFDQIEPHGDVVESKMSGSCRCTCACSCLCACTCHCRCDCYCSCHCSCD